MATKVFILFQGEIFEGMLENQTIFTKNHFSGLSLNEIDRYWTEKELIELLTLNKKKKI